jgi:hypothetical protein
VTLSPGRAGRKNFADLIWHDDMFAPSTTFDGLQCGIQENAPGTIGLPENGRGPQVIRWHANEMIFMSARFRACWII